MVDRNVLNSSSSDLSKAALRLIRDVMMAKEGEYVVFSIDIDTDSRMIRALYDATVKTGATPICVSYPSQVSRGQDLPAPVSEAIVSSSIWLDFARGYGLYTPTRFRAVENGVRFSSLTGMDSRLLVRLIGNVNYAKLLAFGERLDAIMSNSKTFHVRTRLGTDFTGSGEEIHSIVSGKPNPVKGGGSMVIGTLNWSCREETLNGKLVFDGSAWPPEELGVLEEPIVFTIVDGVAKSIEGGREAKILRKWLESLNDPNMYRIAHLTIGYHPNVRRLSGNVLEDERLFADFQIGFGAQGTIFGGKWKAKSHTDLIMRSPEITFDDKLTLEKSRFVDESLPVIWCNDTA